MVVRGGDGEMEFKIVKKKWKREKETRWRLRKRTILPFETVQAGGWQGMGTRHRQKTGGSQSALSPATAGQGAGGGGGCTVRTVSGPVCERTLGNKATPEGHRRGGQNRREGDGFLRVQGSVLSNLTEPRSHGPGPRVTDDLPSRAAVP